MHLRPDMIIHTKQCGPAKVLQQVSDRYYKVQFVNTGTIEKYRNDAIIRGEIRDPYAKLKCGVACTGRAKTKGSNQRIYDVWQHMIDRCYNINNTRSQNYINTFVCERWLVFENFLQDYNKIEGFDINLFKTGQLVLDKDYKQHHAHDKVYSLNTCCWVTNPENARIQDSQQRRFKAISPDGQIYYSDNITEFARRFSQQGLTRKHISGVLHGRAKSTAGWKFVYEDIA